MKWFEAVITTTGAGIEPVSGVLAMNGIEGLQIRDDAEIMRFIAENSDYWDYVDESITNKPPSATTITFYLPADSSGESLLENIRSELRGLKRLESESDFGELTMTLETRDDSAWLDEWKKDYKPLKIGGRLVIKPTWEEYEGCDSEIVVSIDPGNAFGSGLHESTQMCLLQIERLLRSGDRVADLGCGSGILSAAAIKFGASFVYACDIEAFAIDTARENLALNGISEDRFFIEKRNLLSGEDASAAKYGAYDFVLANIVADAIIGLAPVVSDLMNQGGVFVSSGIIAEREAEVRRIVESSGFEIIGGSRAGEWVCLVGQKSTERCNGKIF